MTKLRRIVERLSEAKVAQYKRVMQGRQGRICEIVRLYIEQIMTKSDTAERSLDEARRLSY